MLGTGWTNACWSDDQKFTLDDLCTLSGIPKRTVRYYMQLGLVDRPIGETKAAYYLAQHLDPLAGAAAALERCIKLEFAPA